MFDEFVEQIDLSFVNDDLLKETLDSTLPSLEASDNNIRLALGLSAQATINLLSQYHDWLLSNYEVRKKCQES